LLVLVPRHPDRFERVAALLDTTDFRTVRRSRLQAGAGQAAEQIAGTSVVLLDSMGELPGFYSGCRVAFVGGSLVDRGGHNPLEPAGIGKPVLMGSSRFNFAEICEGLASAGGLLDIDEHTLSDVLEKLAGDAQLAASTGAAGRAFVEANRGAADRVAKIILAGIDQRFRLRSHRIRAHR
jgi:3-deoxy-D-manno-octulosonic-acid transferase